MNKLENFWYALGIVVLMLVSYALTLSMIANARDTIKEQNQQIIELLQNKE